MEAFKCSVVGDSGVGKTTLLITYTTGYFPYNEVPSVYEHQLTSVTVNCRPFSLSLWDTSGQEVYTCSRSLAYVRTDVYLLLFSLISPDSLNNIVSKWHPLVQKHCCNTPTFVVVGTKLDLRDNQAVLERLAEENLMPVTYEQGLAVANKIGAAFYWECSALTRKGVSCIFHETIRNLISSNKNTTDCVVM